MTAAQKLFQRLVPDSRYELDKTKDPTALSKIFLIFISGAFMSKAGDALVNPKITLTWLLSALGAPGFLIGLLVPIRESLSMLPQLWMAGPVNGSSDHRRIWQLSTFVQGISVFAMAVVAMIVDGALAGWLIIILLIVFSLSRCLASLVSKAVLAQHMPKRLRGQTTGWGASGAGLAVVLVGIGLYLLPDEREQTGILAMLMVGAAGLWMFATLLYGRLEPQGGGSGNSRQSSLAQRISTARTDPDFVRFVTTRALLMSSALVAPYYLLLGKTQHGALGTLAGLIIANALASVVSAPFWGRFSDRSSRRVLLIAGTMVALTGAVTTLIALIQPALIKTVWLIPALYFALELSHQGVRIGRKTYLVDLAEDENRVDYVAVSNTAIGALLLLAGLLLSALSSVASPANIIILLSLMSLAGAWLGTGLPEVEVEEH